MAARSGSRTLARGLSLLRALGEIDDGATVAQLSAHTGLDRAVLYRLLSTLVDEGFVVRDPATRRYHLGVALAELGSRAGRGLDVPRLAGASMRALMELTDEAVCLAVPERDHAVVVDRVEPAGLFLTTGYRIGFRHPLDVGAHGQVMLAFLPEDEGLPELPGTRRSSILDTGFAVTTDQLEIGASGVAAPILDARGRAVAALGIVVPTVRLSQPTALGRHLATVARDISRRIGWIDPDDVEELVG